MVRLTRDDITAIVGPLDDARVTEIIASQATKAELTEAFEWLTQSGDMGPDMRHSLTGKVAQLVDILRLDEPESTNRR